MGQNQGSAGKIEIERRWLARIVPGFDLGKVQSSEISQAYLSRGNPAVRVRYQDGVFFLTVKKGSGMVRQEVEFQIPRYRGQDLMEMSTDHIRKKRLYMDRWVVDKFHGPLDGLVIVEIELTSREEELPPSPPWVQIGREITGEDREWSNQALSLLSDEEARRLVAETYGD